jgi:hypothetical protein
MASDFKTVLTKDPTIADITSDLVYAVKSGASSTTYQPFPSTSATNSVQVFNIQVPSENIVIGRDALIQCPLQFTLNISNVPVNDVAIAWGQSAALQAFPLASIMTTASATINNSTVSVNLQDVLPMLLHLNSNRDLYRYNGMCPSLPDQNWGSYVDAFGANSSPLASYYNQSYDNDQAPRGAHPCYVQINRYIANAFQDHSNVSTGVANENWRVYVFTTVTEPIFLSPFIYADPEHNRQGMLGVNNMALTFNINSTLNRLVSVAKASAGSVYTIAAGVGADPDGGLWLADSNLFRNAYAVPGIPTASSGGPTILLKLLSSQPSDKLETRNVLPYFDLPRYLTSSANNANFPIGVERRVVSQSIQLSQLPDYFIIVARKPVTEQTITDTSSFLTIRSMSMNLNNQSGLLSSASAQDLWRLSVKNGSQQTWSEFSGSAFVNAPDGQGGLVPTTGSVFIVSPTDLSLPDYLTAGSLGAFQLQFEASVYNQFNEVVNVELCVVACNSGIFVLQQGTANIYTGILTREAVIASKKERPVDEPDRMIGGKLLNRGMVRHPRHLGMKMMAGPREMGGAMSAGAMSAGRSRLSGMY